MWIYQAVTNVGIQVLLLMAVGWAFSRFRLLEQAKFLPQSNFLVLYLALPAFNLYLMGIRLDLQNPDPWKSLAAFLLWVMCTQLAVLLYTWRFCGGDAAEAAIINMVLLMNNYGITGLLALNATLGTKWGSLSLLMAIGFFVLIFPFSLTAFEWEKWAVEKHLEATAANAAVDIEAATAAAAAAEAADVAASGGGGGRDDDGGGGGGAAALNGTGGTDAAAKAAAAEGLDPIQLSPPGWSPKVRRSGGGGGGEVAGVHMYGLADRTSIAPPPAAPAAAQGAAGGARISSSGGSGGGGSDHGQGARRSGGPQGSSFPHKNRYCWWSNEEYQPHAPLLHLTEAADADGAAEMAEADGDPLYMPPPPPLPTLPSAQQQPQQPRWWRRDLPSPSSTAASATHGSQRLPSLPSPQRGTYMPPTPTSPTGRGASANASAAVVSPFSASAALGWPSTAAADGAIAAAGNSPASSRPSSRLPPPLPSGARRHTGAAAGSGGGPLTPTAAAASALADRRGSSVLASAIERLAEARSTALPTGLYGELAGGPPAAAAEPPPLMGSVAPTGARPREGSAKRPALENLEFALTHQLSGGTAIQLARATRGVAAAAAAATAAAASPNVSMRRMLLAATGAPPPPPLSSQQQHQRPLPMPMLSHVMRSHVPSRAASEPLAAATQAPPSPASAGGTVTAVTSPPPVQVATEATTGAVGNGNVAGASPHTSAGGGAAAAALAAHTQPQPLHARSLPVPGMQFTASERQDRRLTGGAGGTGDAAGGGAGGGGGRDALDTALLELASGLSFSREAAVRSATAAASRRRMRAKSETDGDAGTVPLLDFAAADSAFRRLTTAAAAGLEAAAAVDASAASAAAASDKRLVREATAEALRRHGGLAGAFAAFVRGHPQLWHIVSILAKNPMIWTMFLAMAISVTGLRTFLDPASRRYRPELGWVAGSLSWINGLVVPLSIFANGAWMHGKRLLPAGQGTKMLVLFLIKIGLLPLFMVGCALAVRLDGQHVAALTLLSLCPAAATSFVLAVQYGRGVELVSLTNILGNLLLTPVLVMWLKILGAMHIDFRLHDDA